MENDTAVMSAAEACAFIATLSETKLTDFAAYLAGRIGETALTGIVADFAALA